MTEQGPIRVLIADDNRSFRRGIRLRLDHAPGIVVIGEASNGRDAVAAARSEAADVVLMDLEMPGMNGIEATRILSEGGAARVGVVVLTSHGADAHVLSALRAGASGYLLKMHDTDQLLEAIRAAARGDALVSPRVTAPVLRALAQAGEGAAEPGPLVSLSPSERRVVRLLSSGVTSNEDIAADLSVSVHTVRSHVQSAMRKVGVADRTQLALWGVRAGFDSGRARPNG